MDGTKRILGLDFLGLVAISMFLCAQYFWLLPNRNLLLDQVASVACYVGLEIFFVLSGVLFFRKVSPLYVGGAFKLPVLKHLLRRLLIRILPWYFFFLIINICLAIILDFPVMSLWEYFLLLQNFASPMPPFFQESWILTTILFAAIFFSALLFFFDWCFRFKDKSFGLLLTILFLIVLSLATKFFYSLSNVNTTVSNWDVALKAVVIYRFDSVLIGALAGWLLQRFPNFIMKFRFLFAVFGAAGIGFILIGIGYFQLLIEQYPFFWNVLYLPMTSAIIAFFIPLLWDWTRVQIPIARVSSNVILMVYFFHSSMVLKTARYYFSKRQCDAGTIILVAFLYLLFSFLLASWLDRFYRRNRLLVAHGRV